MERKTRKVHYLTCDDCGEEWRVSERMVRQAILDGTWFCETCIQLDADNAYVEDAGHYGDYAIYGE